VKTGIHGRSVTAEKTPRDNITLAEHDSLCILILPSSFGSSGQCPLDLMPVSCHSVFIKHVPTVNLQFLGHHHVIASALALLIAP
jgi:hypothetical protein